MGVANHLTTNFFRKQTFQNHIIVSIFQFLRLNPFSERTFAHTMDRLNLLVKTMNTSEIKHFRTFIHSQRKLDKRKDLELFDLLTKDPQPDNLELQLYGKENKEAYHAVRKRLLNKLSDYIVVTRIEEDYTAASSVMGHISLSEYLFERGMDQLAWSYLKNGEKIAKANEQYALLNTIYLLQIKQAEFADDLNEIIEKKSSVKLLADEDERATIAYSLIRKELKNVVVEGKEVDFSGIIKLVLTSYNLTNAALTRPKILYNILSISRSEILAKKDFYTFEPYLIEQYETAKEKYGFSKNSHFYKLSILYMIVHVLYRNRKFELATDYLDEMNVDLYAFNETQLRLFYPRYVLLNAAVKCYQGKLDEAIEILENELKEEEASPYFTEKDLIKLKINLGLYKFFKKDFGFALRVNSALDHSDKWFEKNLGKEWNYKKGIMEAIAQVESGNLEIALNRIRSIERSYSQLFSNPLHQRTKTFLSLMKKYIQDPHTFSWEEQGISVEKTLTTVPSEQEDLQAMTFYAWLKSKLIKRDFYNVLLEMVHKGNGTNQ